MGKRSGWWVVSVQTRSIKKKVLLQMYSLYRPKCICDNNDRIYFQKLPLS